MTKRFCTRLQTGFNTCGAIGYLVRLCFILSLGIGAARAQFLGFTSPQTITLPAKFSATGVGGTSTSQSCAGVGSGVFFNVTNIGQSVHYVLYQTSGPITSQAIEIQGSRDGTAGSFQRISETANAITAGGVFASLYLPIVRIAITSCTGTGTITATYTGTSVATGPPVGIFTSSGTYNKDVAVGLPANATATFTVPLPNGGTGGAVYFKYSVATCAGSTLTVSAGPDATHQITLLAASALTNTANTQAFTVPAIPATIAIVTYTTGCVASAATYDLSFSVGERIVTANFSAVFNGGDVVAPSTPGFSCQSFSKLDYASTAGVNTIVTSPNFATTRLHFCNLFVTFDAATNLKFLIGNGANCGGGGATEIGGPFYNVVSVALDYGWWGALTAAPGNNFCIQTSGNVNVGGQQIWADF